MIIKIIKAMVFTLLLGVNACEAQLLPTCNMNYKELLAGINAHKSSSFMEFVKCRQHYDGGNLEDLYRASGSYLEVNPNKYLAVLSDYNITKREMENFLLMLSLSTVDNIELQKAEINKRINIIKTTKSSKIKSAALEILINELIFLSSIKSLN